MPLDVFDKVCTIFEEDPNYSTELVAYRRLPGSQSAYHFSRFPLSLSQPGRALEQVLWNSNPDRLESIISKQLTGYIGDDRIYYENLSGSAFDDLGRSLSKSKMIEQILFKEAQRLFEKQKTLSVEVYKVKIKQQIVGEINCLIDRCYDAARISTEHAERILNVSNTRRLREAFVNLTNEYAALSHWKRNSDDLFEFIKKLAEFYQVVEQEFFDMDKKQHELVLEIKNVSEKLEKRFRKLFGVDPQSLRTLHHKKQKSSEDNF